MAVKANEEFDEAATKAVASVFAENLERERLEREQKALEEERLGVLSESARDHQRQRSTDAGRVDRPAEPGTEGVGAISLPGRSKGNLQQAGSPDLLANLEVGEA